MSKYEDLAEAIHNDGIDAYWDEIGAVLRWLDEHPDQVPGRTITESEVREIFIEIFDYIGLKNLQAGIERLGRAVVPDPEPTRPNVPGEKFQARLFNSFDDPTDWMVVDDSQVVRLSDGYLIRFREFDAHWKITKAPGGDDER